MLFLPMHVSSFLLSLLKQRSYKYARDNEESELIPTSLMIGKEKQTKTQYAQVSWTFI